MPSFGLLSTLPLHYDNLVTILVIKKTHMMPPDFSVMIKEGQRNRNPGPTLLVLKEGAIVITGKKGFYANY